MQYQNRQAADDAAYNMAVSLACLPQQQWGRQEQEGFAVVVQAAKPFAFRQASAKGWSQYMDGQEISQAAAEASWEVVKYLRRHSERVVMSRPEFMSLLSMRVRDALMERGRAALGQRHGRATHRKALRLRQLREAGFTPEEIQAKLGLSEQQYETYSDVSYEYDGGISAATEEQERLWAEEAADETSSVDWDIFWARSQEFIEAAAGAGHLPRNAPEFWSIRRRNPEATLAEVGASMGISTARVGQVQDKVYLYLSKNMDRLVEYT
jgi:hypothetical protein